MTTRRKVRELAYELWVLAGKPDADSVSPQHFWLEAETMLTPEIVLAIATELRKHGISRMPGDTFYDDFYYDDASPEDGHPRFILAGVLHENGVYSVVAEAIHHHFDLNREESLEKLIEFILSRRHSNPKSTTFTKETLQLMKAWYGRHNTEAI